MRLVFVLSRAASRAVPGRVFGLTCFAVLCFPSACRCLLLVWVLSRAASRAVHGPLRPLRSANDAMDALDQLLRENEEKLDEIQQMLAGKLNKELESRSCTRTGSWR